MYACKEELFARHSSNVSYCSAQAIHRIEKDEKNFTVKLLLIAGSRIYTGSLINAGVLRPVF